MRDCGWGVVGCLAILALCAWWFVRFALGFAVGCVDRGCCLDCFVVVCCFAGWWLLWLWQVVLLCVVNVVFGLYLAWC